MQLISLHHKKLHWMYYNWLNFPVNLQLMTQAKGRASYYNWLNFLVNLQRSRVHWRGSDYYNWLNFPINLQPSCRSLQTTSNYNWLNFLVNLQPINNFYICYRYYNWLNSPVNLQSLYILNNQFLSETNAKSAKLCFYNLYVLPDGLWFFCS